METHNKNNKMTVQALEPRTQEHSKRTRTGTHKETDHQIVGLLKRKDAAGLEKLMEKYHARLFTKAVGICGNMQDAEEVLQDVYMTTVRKIDQFEERSKLFTWLYRVTVNSALMKKRKVKRKEALFENTDEIPFLRDVTRETPQAEMLFQEDAVFLSEMRTGFLQTVQKLPEKYKAVALLNANGYNVLEMGEILSLHPAAVKSRLYRSRQLMRVYLKDYICPN